MTDIDPTTLTQGSDEWKAARVGSLGGSRIADMLAKTKTGWGAMRANLAAELVAEKLTGVPYEGFTSSAMERGKEVEADARRAYAFRTGFEVKETGLWKHPTIKGTHASPDGLVGDHGVVEFKCPNTSTHIETLRGAIIPKVYREQQLWEMACTGREFCDFVSFDPRLPESMSLAIKRVHLDAARLAEVEAEVRKFLAEVDEAVAELRRLYETGTLADQLRASL
jgi:putative phage-type endonuclease